jgi:hypothetical protein
VIESLIVVNGTNKTARCEMVKTAFAIMLKDCNEPWHTNCVPTLSAPCTVNVWTVSIRIDIRYMRDHVPIENVVKCEIARTVPGIISLMEVTINEPSVPVVVLGPVREMKGLAFKTVAVVKVHVVCET